MNSPLDSNQSADQIFSRIREMISRILADSGWDDEYKPAMGRVLLAGAGCGCAATLPPDDPRTRRLQALLMGMAIAINQGGIDALSPEMVEIYAHEMGEGEAPDEAMERIKAMAERAQNGGRLN